MVDAVSVICRNAHDVEIVSEYHTLEGSSPSLDTIPSNYTHSIVGQSGMYGERYRPVKKTNQPQAGAA